MTADVYFQKELNGTYSLIVDGEVFNTPITDEEQMSVLVEDVENGLYSEDDSIFTIKLSDESPSLGIIIDVYINDTENEPFESYHILFDDYSF